MTDARSMLEEWLVPVVLCICGVQSVVNVLRRPSAYWLVLAIVQFCVFFVLFMFRDLRRSRIFLAILLCTLLAEMFVHSWYRYAQHRPADNRQLVSTVLLGSLLIGSILGTVKSIFISKEREDESITQLNI